MVSAGELVVVLVLVIFVYVLPIGGALWIYFDAKKYDSNGAIWAIGTFSSGIFALVMITIYHQTRQSRSKISDRVNVSFSRRDLSIILIAAILAVITWGYLPTILGREGQWPTAIPRIVRQIALSSGPFALFAGQLVSGFVAGFLVSGSTRGAILRGYIAGAVSMAGITQLGLMLIT